MNATSTQLLKLLSSGVSPAGGAPRAAPGAQTFGAAAFADLLKQAQDGGLVSKVPVTVAGDAEGAGVHLDDEQLARLCIAADKLETAGVRTALVTIDGQKLVLDVHARQITRRAESENGVVSGVDGVIDLGDARTQDAIALAGAQNAPDGAGTAPGPLARLGLPSGTLSGNPSVAKLLAELAGGVSA